VKHLPLFFDLAHRKVAVVGDGPKADLRANLARSAGAAVVRLHGPVMARELRGAVAVFVATEDDAADAAAHHQAKAAGVPVNVGEAKGALPSSAVCSPVTSATECPWVAAANADEACVAAEPRPSAVRWAAASAPVRSAPSNYSTPIARLNCRQVCLMKYFRHLAALGSGANALICNLQKAAVPASHHPRRRNAAMAAINPAETSHRARKRWKG